MSTPPVNTVLKSNRLPLSKPNEVVLIRQGVRTLAIEIGLNLVDQTKIITAASELARNTVIHGGGGEATLEIITDGVRKGLQLAFEDKGKGIPDIERALADGFTTGTGLGLGLGGAKRLSNEMYIESAVDQGTKNTIIKWKG